MTRKDRSPRAAWAGRHRTSRILLAAGLALLVAGCGSASETGSLDAQSAPQPAVAEGGAPADVPVDAKASLTVSSESNAQVIRTAYLALRVADVTAGLRDIVTKTAGAGGSVTDQQVSGQGEAISATLTVKVPASGLDAYLAAIQALGSVDSVSISAVDVTTQAVDLDARIAALRASIRRLATLMDQATSVTDLVAIEGEQTRRQADLDSLVAQRQALGDQVAMSTVTITLSPIVAGSTWVPPGFGPGLTAGWTALVSLGGILVTAAGFLLPFLVALAVIAAVVVPLIWWIVRRRRATRRATGQDTTSTR